MGKEMGISHFTIATEKLVVRVNMKIIEESGIGNSFIAMGS